ncbi:hypothetical protein [Planktotalea sp.]|uniref:hypothetical protein n=1 Tax=Planktotalea sp. TaxID=2029877 RepID=UPI003D6B60CD
MTIPSKAIRFERFIERLRSERRADDRSDAHFLMTEVMNAIEDGYGFEPNDYSNRMHVFTLSADFDWKNIDDDPCYWDDALSAKHRTEIFNNGRIVITQIHEPKAVLLDKAGSYALADIR